MTRVPEFFGTSKPLEHQSVLVSSIRRCFPQERDRTCSVACLRTLLSAFEDEPMGELDIIEFDGLVPGPHFSKELQCVSCLKGYSVRVSDCVNSSFDAVLDLVEVGYVLMLESMYNFGHWMVFLGYYPDSSGSDEAASLLLYGPYYDRVRLVCLDEFLCMWQDGMHHENGVYHDFLAIRPLRAG